MAATNETTNYKLPLFVGTDKPSWLGDWNAAMTAIDTAIGTAAGDATNAGTVATSAKTAAEAAQASVAGLTQSVGTLEDSLDELKETVTVQGNAIESLQNKPAPTFNPSYAQVKYADSYSATLIYVLNMGSRGEPLIGMSQVYNPTQNVFLQGNNSYIIGYIDGNPLALENVVYNQNKIYDLYIGFAIPLSTNGSIMQAGYFFFYDSSVNRTYVAVYGLPSYPSNIRFMIPFPNMFSSKNGVTLNIAPFTYNAYN